MKIIDCFIFYEEIEGIKKTIQNLLESELVNNIYLLTKSSLNPNVEKCDNIPISSLMSTDTVKKIADKSQALYTMIYLKNTTLELGQFSLERFYQIANDTQAGLIYSDYYQITNGTRSKLPLIDYQLGSVRDDFNFGSVLFYNTECLKKAVSEFSENYQYAGFYDLRLKVSQCTELIHIDEYLYSDVELDIRKSGEKQFDYVDPKNREIQLEMEKACTDHLKKIDAYLKPVFKKISFNEEKFPVEASIIIPVKNRVTTIEDAIRSALSQKTTFEFNVIIVDNYSTDGTSQIIAKYAKKDERIIHVIPEREDLLIGGCWNLAIHHPLCGKFAVQLDSDDIYQDENTLQTIVEAFYEQNCGMVVGSYTTTDFNMNILPPGLIDHKEWTPENGRNNALRVNGFGAPRAFYTPLLRKIKVPNSNYGEDYALGLVFSRDYQIGRIYRSLYLCRRWKDNSDAELDPATLNLYNHYKDKIRTIEIKARQQKNKLELNK
ncbi:MAG TPA: glycosyltransferase family A protein [Paludibacteraceae bacterium]|nr:glycosyltransferase family A protein [Paludibacteraceae bacterium]